jgi:hypothetical protein
LDFFKYATLAAGSVKKFLQTAVLGYIFIYIQIKYQYIIPYTYLTIGGKNLSHNGCSKITVGKCFPEGPGQSG